MNEKQNDTIKFWTFLTMMILGVAVAVTLIDLTIKTAILTESNSMKIRMEEWEVRYGQTAAGRNVEGNPSNGHFDRGISGDILDSNDAGLEAGGSANGDKAPTPKRARNGRFIGPSDGN